VTPPEDLPKIDLDEILAEMDELGRAKFDAALERVKTRKLVEANGVLQARIRELEGQRAVPDPLKNGGPPRAVRDAADLAAHTREAGAHG
jgi:BMFP domain-containing protein YqiC